MHKSSEEELSAEQPEITSVLGNPEYDVVEAVLSGDDQQEISGDLALLDASGGLDDWRSFTALRAQSLSATADQLPNLTLLESGPELDGSAVEAPKLKGADESTVIKPAVEKDDKDAAVGSLLPVFDESAVIKPIVTENRLEGPQTIPTEPPKITDPLPADPPGLKLIVDRRDTPGFSITQPELRGDQDGQIGRSIKPAPDAEGGLSIPTEPPRLFTPSPIVPPGHHRTIDQSFQPAKGFTIPGSSPALRDASISPAAKGIHTANDKVTQTLESDRLRALLAAQMEQKKLSAQNPDKALKDLFAGVENARKNILRGGAPADRTQALKTAFNLQSNSANEFKIRPAGKPPVQLNAEAEAQGQQGLKLVGGEVDLVQTEPKLDMETALPKRHQLAESEVIVYQSVVGPEPHPTLLKRHQSAEGEILGAQSVLQSELHPTILKRHKAPEAETMVDGQRKQEPILVASWQGGTIADAKPSEPEPRPFKFVEQSAQGQVELVASTNIVGNHSKLLFKEAKPVDSSPSIALLDQDVYQVVKHKDGVIPAAQGQSIEANKGVRSQLQLAGIPQHNQFKLLTMARSLSENTSQITIGPVAHLNVKDIGKNKPEQIAHDTANSSDSLTILPVNHEGYVHGKGIKVATVEIKNTFEASSEPDSDAAKKTNTVCFTEVQAQRHIALTSHAKDSTRDIGSVKTTVSLNNILTVENGEELPAGVPAAARQTAHARHSLAGLTDLADLANLKGLERSEITKDSKDSKVSKGWVSSAKPPTESQHPATSSTEDTAQLITKSNGEKSNLAKKQAVSVVHAKQTFSENGAPLRITDENFPSNFSRIRLSGSTQRAITRAISRTALNTTSTSQAIVSHFSVRRVEPENDLSKTAPPLTPISKFDAGQNETPIEEVSAARTTIDTVEGSASAKSLDDYKVRIMYMHVGKHVFILQRRLVEKSDAPDKSDSSSSQLVAYGSAAAVISARYWRRRRRKAESDEHARLSDDEKLNPQDDCISSELEFKPGENQAMAAVVSRFKYMIQPADTLEGLAQSIWQDTCIAWLILEVNKLDQSWDGSCCTVKISERQIIDLPLPDEVVEFYRSGRTNQYRDCALVTSVEKAALDDELAYPRVNIAPDTSRPSYQTAPSCPPL